MRCAFAGLVLFGLAGCGPFSFPHVEHGQNLNRKQCLLPEGCPKS